MEESEYRELFESFTPEQVMYQAILMSLECERLRRELDEANGVIR